MTPQTPTKLYLYLARRDKKGMQVLAIFTGTSTTTRVSDIRLLGLDPETESTISKIIYDNRMYWEPWVEPASSFIDLKKRLSERGFKNLPLAGSPVVELPGGTVMDTSRLPGQKTMIQRGG